MSALLSNFFQALNNEHPRQKQAAATNPELAAVRADVDNLLANTEKLASVVDMLFDAANKAAEAAPVIVEQYFAKKGIKARLVASGEKRHISPEARRACKRIFGEFFEACNQSEVSDYE